jgi:hypothetical protein
MRLAEQPSAEQRSRSARNCGRDIRSGEHKTDYRKPVLRAGCSIFQISCRHVHHQTPRSGNGVIPEVVAQR